MRGSVKIKRNNITKSVGKIQQRFKTVPKKAFAFWRKITPIRSGNARRKTTLKGDVINARYPYAVRLDEGWSKQAPRGMYEPTWEYVKRITRKMVRKQ